MSLKHTFDRFRQPEYVGENRCLPCTAINLAIAATVAGATIAFLVVVGFSTGVSLAAGALVLSGCAAVVYLRGYLVPGTPTLTKRYLPVPVLRLFGKAPGPSRDDAGNVDVEATLLDAGVVEPCHDTDDLCLTPAFEADWRARIDALAASEPELEQLLERRELAGIADRSDVTFAQRGEAYVVHVDGARIAQWESRAAYLADAAAAAEIRDRYAAWRAMGFRERTEVAGSLRLWLQRCPVCDGPVAMDRETVSSCCREREVLASSCADCGSRLFEADIDPDAL
jgi:hypothetical protein